MPAMKRLPMSARRTVTVRSARIFSWFVWFVFWKDFVVGGGIGVWWWSCGLSVRRVLNHSKLLADCDVGSLVLVLLVEEEAESKPGFDDEVSSSSNRVGLEIVCTCTGGKSIPSMISILPLRYSANSGSVCCCS